MNIRLYAAALVGAVAISAAAYAQAVSSTFTISNASGSDLVAIYAGPSTDPDWGHNILTDTVYNGEDFVVTLNDPYGQCYWDIRYDFADGDVFEEYEVDICSIHGETFEISSGDGIK
tara:strand:+ start:1531 stop:1881 length:351 start_codon:yes stop_codon:yes gene_type:complete